MVKGDLFTSPINFALKETMKQFEHDAELYESLKRSLAVWESISVNGLDVTTGMTHEQFCEQLEKKKNIVFLSDDEVKNISKALAIMTIVVKMLE